MGLRIGELSPDFDPERNRDGPSTVKTTDREAPIAAVRKPAMCGRIGGSRINYSCKRTLGRLLQGHRAARRRVRSFPDISPMPAPDDPVILFSVPERGG